MVNMEAEAMLEKLSRCGPASQQRVTWSWCLRKRDSNKILKVSEQTCVDVPGLTVTVIPEPISWYHDAIDPVTGQPILISPLRRWWYRLWWSGYECQIVGEARQIQVYLRILADRLNAN